MLSADRALRLKGLDTYQSYQVAADAVIHHHAVVAVVDGYLVPASDTANTKVVGVATEPIDNRGNPDGAVWCHVYKGAARLPTTGATPIEQAHVGQTAHVLDDEHVVLAADTTNQIAAGEILEVEPGYAWVRLGA